MSGHGGPLPALFLLGPGTPCRGLVLFVSGHGALCRGPALLCVVPGALVSGPGRSLCRDGGPLPALFLSGPDLCVGAGHSLCRGAPLCLSGPPGASALCVGALRRSLCVRTRRSVSACVSSPGGLQWCRRLGRCFCVSMRGPALFVSGTLSVGAGPGAPCRGPALFVSGRGALCVGAQRSLCRARCRGPGALAGPGALSVRARHSLCQGRALSVGARRSLCRASCRGPAVSVGARRSVCRGPALFVSGSMLCLSGPGALCVRARALCVGAQRSLCRAFLLSSGTLCQDVFGARIVSVSELGALQRSLCPGALRRSLSDRDPALASALMSESVSLFLLGFGGLCVRARPRGAPAPIQSPLRPGPPALIHQLASATHPPPGPPQLPSACHPSSPALFSPENPKLCCLGDETDTDDDDDDDAVDDHDDHAAADDDDHHHHDDDYDAEKGNPAGRRRRSF